MSDSESMEEVPLGFLNEDLDKEDDKIIRILEEKKPSLVRFESSYRNSASNK
jgi:hypothetical protein